MGKIQLNEQLAKAQQTRAQRAMASEKRARDKVLHEVRAYGSACAISGITKRAAETDMEDMSFTWVTRVAFTAVVRALSSYHRAILKAHQ